MVFLNTGLRKEPIAKCNVAGSAANFIPPDFAPIKPALPPLIQDVFGQAWREITAPKRFRDIFISDIHLGSLMSCSDAALRMLGKEQPSRIYLVGDITDYWRVGKEKGRQLTVDYLRAIRTACPEAFIVLLPGNHDDALRHKAEADAVTKELDDERFALVHDNEITYQNYDGTLTLVLHGDGYDITVSNRKAGVAGTYLNEGLAAADAGINYMAQKTGLSGTSSPFDFVRRKLDGMKWGAISSNAIADLHARNNAIRAWNLANHEQSLPHIKKIIFAHAHRAADIETPSPCGTMRVSIGNTGCWLTGDPRLPAQTGKPKYPTCTFHGVEADGTEGYFHFDRTHEINVPLNDKNSMGIFLNPYRSDTASRVTSQQILTEEYS